MAVTQNLSIGLSGQNIANNTTTVNITLTSTQSGESHNGNTLTGYYWISVNGGSETQYSFTTTLPKGSTITCFSVNHTFTHEADGTGSISVRTSLDTRINAGTVTTSASYTPATIPRSSAIDSFTCSTSYLDGVISVKFTPKASSFYYKLRLSIPHVISIATDNLGNKATSQQTVTHTFTSAQLSTIYSKSSSTSAAVSIGAVIETYSDSGYSNKVGESPEVAITLQLPASIVPTILSVALTDPNGYAATYGGYVQNKSKVKVQVTSAGVYGSTISKVSITANGVTTTSNPYTSNVITAGTGSKAVSVTVTDSRGRTATRTATYTVVNYSSPRISKLYASRCDSAGNADDGGAYIKITYACTITDVNSKNTPKITLRYKRQEDSNYTNIVNVSAYSRDTSTVIEASTESRYTISLVAQDVLSGSIEQIVNVSTAFTLMDFNASGKGLAIGQVSTKDALEIAMELETSRNAKVGGELTVDGVGNITSGVRTASGSAQKVRFYCASKVVTATGGTSVNFVSNSELDAIFGVSNCSNGNVAMFVSDGDSTASGSTHFEGATYVTSNNSWYVCFNQPHSGELRVNYMAVYFG